MNARNNYAHPTFESPTQNQVISYLYFAVEYVLKRPPYYSFLYAKSLIENHLATDPFYWEGKNNIQIQNYAKMKESMDYLVKATSSATKFTHNK